MNNKQTPHPFFSIIIPTLNEALYLPKLLSDLVKQTHQDFSVIVVDAESKDQTLTQAKRYEEKLNLKVKRVTKRNVGYQRNQGAKLAQGDWLLFMDADNRLPDYFLEGTKYQLSKNPEVDLFSSWAAVKNKNINRKLIIQAANLALEINRTFGYPSVYGSLLGVKKEIFAKTEFDEQQQVAEDFLLAQELVKKGYNFELFKEPRHYFSFRRIEKEGSLKMAKTLALIQLRYLQGKDFKDRSYGYVMEGGQYYQEDSALKNILLPLVKLQELLKNASEKQLKQAREVFQNLKDQLNND